MPFFLQASALINEDGAPKAPKIMLSEDDETTLRRVLQSKLHARAEGLFVFQDDNEMQALQLTIIASLPEAVIAAHMLSLMDSKKALLLYQLKATDTDEAAWYGPFLAEKELVTGLVADGSYNQAKLIGLLDSLVAAPIAPRALFQLPPSDLKKQMEKINATSNQSGVSVEKLLDAGREFLDDTQLMPRPEESEFAQAVKKISESKGEEKSHLDEDLANLVAARKALQSEKLDVLFLERLEELERLLNKLDAMPVVAPPSPVGSDAGNNSPQSNLRRSSSFGLFNSPRANEENKNHEDVSDHHIADMMPSPRLTP